MKIRLDRIKDEPVEFAFEEPAEILQLAGEGTGTEGMLSVKVLARRFDSGITLEAEASVTEIFECSRCLERFKDTVSVRFEYFCREGSEPGVREDPDDEQMLYYHPEVKEIDIADYVREQIIMDQPVKPLCSPDCRGLCQGCGKKLGTEECTCSAKPVDPRWERLKDIT